MNQSSPHWLNLQTMILQLIMCHTIKIRTNISCNQIKVRESARYQANIWWASYLFTYLRDIDPTQLSQSRKYNTEHFPNYVFHFIWKKLFKYFFLHCYYKYGDPYLQVIFSSSNEKIGNKNDLPLKSVMDFIKI